MAPKAIRTDTTEHPPRGDMGTRKLIVKKTPGTPPERPPLTRKSKNELTKVLEKGNHPCNPREGTQERKKNLCHPSEPPPRDCRTQSTKTRGSQTKKILRDKRDREKPSKHMSARIKGPHKKCPRDTELKDLISFP